MTLNWKVSCQHTKVVFFCNLDPSKFASTPRMNPEWWRMSVSVCHRILVQYLGVATCWHSLFESTDGSRHKPRLPFFLRCYNDWKRLRRANWCNYSSSEHLPHCFAHNSLMSNGMVDELRRISGFFSPRRTRKEPGNHLVSSHPTTTSSRLDASELLRSLPDLSQEA